MLFLLFQIGKDRYALEASRVVEVVPLLALKELPQAPKGVAGLFNYRGALVPAVDLSELASGQKASERVSTRIIIVNCQDGRGRTHLLGLIAERATEMLRREAKEFVRPGLEITSAPYLGPILLEASGAVQWIDEQRLLPEAVREALFAERA